MAAETAGDAVVARSQAFDFPVIAQKGQIAHGYGVDHESAFPLAAAIGFDCVGPAERTGGCAGTGGLRWQR
jgi:hypothetical protein